MSIADVQTASNPSNSRRSTRVPGEPVRVDSGSRKRKLQCASGTLARGPARFLARARKARRRAYGLAALPVGTPADPFETAERITTTKAAIREHCRLCMSGSRAPPRAAAELFRWLTLSTGRWVPEAELDEVAGQRGWKDWRREWAVLVRLHKEGHHEVSQWRLLADPERGYRLEALPRSKRKIGRKA